MSSVTVRIRPKSHKVLRKIAQQTNQSMQDVLERVIEEHRRKLFVDAANRAYAALRADPKAWQEELEERAIWEATLADGLEDD